MHYLRNYTGLWVTMMLGCAISCRVDVPLKQMTLAKMTITRAYEVRADVYAPAELKKATEQLYRCHELLIKEKSSPAADADKALEYARIAVEKSLPLLSQDTLKEAGTLYTAVEKLFDPDNAELKTIAREMEKAAALHNAKTYWDAYCQSKKNINDLKNLSESRNAELKSVAGNNLEIAENRLNRIRKEPVPETHKDKLYAAIPLVEKARKLYRSGDYPGSIRHSTDAEELLNAIAITIEKKAETRRIERLKKNARSKKTRTYVVTLNPKKRDCLWRIASAVYKDATLWPIIYVANRDKIKNPDLIFPGQKFIIPPLPDKKEMRKKRHAAYAALKKELAKARKEDSAAPDDEADDDEDDADESGGSGSSGDTDGEIKKAKSTEKIKT